MVPLGLIVAATALFFVLERVIPGRQLPEAPGWYARAAFLNLDEGKLDEAIAIATRNRKSPIASLVATGLSEFTSAPPHSTGAEVIEAAERGLERSLGTIHAELKRGLSGLATIGSTAPFVGLFGTVVGIMNAFRASAPAKATGIQSVASGISEALVTTALGLLVAVPAVWCYNYFTSTVETSMWKWKIPRWSW